MWNEWKCVKRHRRREKSTFKSWGGPQVGLDKEVFKTYRPITFYVGFIVQFLYNFLSKILTFKEDISIDVL